MEGAHVSIIPWYYKAGAALLLLAGVAGFGYFRGLRSSSEKLGKVKEQAALARLQAEQTIATVMGERDSCMAGETQRELATRAAVAGAQAETERVNSRLAQLERTHAYERGRLEAEVETLTAQLQELPSGDRCEAAAEWAGERYREVTGAH